MLCARISFYQLLKWDEVYWSFLVLFFGWVADGKPYNTYLTYFLDIKKILHEKM